MLFSTWLHALWQQALSREALVQRLARHGPPGRRFVPFFSGRVALTELARLPCFGRRVVLLPTYICNVVPLAFERAGFDVHGYGVDERFEPNALALAAQAERSGADVLVLAPLYGAEGGVGWWLGAEGRSVRERLGLTLVLDLCQDAGRLMDLPDPGSNCVALTSFNDKAFPGVMGAALWTDLALQEPYAPGWRAAILLNLRVLRRLLLPASRRRSAGFEFSQATRFPWGFDCIGATKLQLALGAIGFERLPLWQARRRAALETGKVRAQMLPFSGVSPFVVAAADDPGCHRAKPPYAQMHDAAASLLPGLIVRHNKGFDDA